MKPTAQPSDLRKGGLDKHAVHFLKNLGLENGVYMLSIPLSPRIFYPEYPENPKSLGESIRKARIDRGLMIKELATLIGTSEDSIINWEYRDRKPMKRFHNSLKEVLGIQI